MGPCPGGGGEGGGGGCSGRHRRGGGRPWHLSAARPCLWPEPRSVLHCPCLSTHPMERPWAGGPEPAAAASTAQPRPGLHVGCTDSLFQSPRCTRAGPAWRGRVNKWKPALGSLALDVARDYGALSSSPNLQPGEPLPHSLIERARIPGGPSTRHTQKQQQLEGKHSDIPAGETGRSAAPGHCAAPTSAPRIPSQTPQALPTAPTPK